jgi:phosphonate transport system substrate-binding protein
MFNFNAKSRGLLRTFSVSLLLLCLPIASAAPLKILLQEEGGSDADAANVAARYAPLKKILEKAVGRPVDISLTLNRARVTTAMAGNAADVYILQSSDLAAKALTELKYLFMATARPDVNALFVGYGAAVDSPKAFSGQNVAMPKADSSFGQICRAELDAFNATGYTPQHNNEMGAVMWAVENKVSAVGCIPSNSRVKEALAAKKITVLYEGRLMQSFPVIGAPGLAAADRIAVTKALTSLDESEAGEAAIKPLGVTGFTEGGELRLRALSSFLKPK